MYNQFFGFREKPFKLVPNPEYLFLSKSHEEALAHLNYAISQGDGFVEITGEVGTGKTTLCRAFLEGLDDTTVAAYIFNPSLGPRQLLETINDEFGIAYDAGNTKDLIDKLNAFLLRKKAERQRVLILIDEAQNLAKNVLEQLRLLSNLETSKEKLLQIILVGQPELAAMLESYELRQLGQRITLRYFLTPLSRRETREYIQYRLNIASQRKGIRFDRAAVSHIFKYTGGIPRLINIACDRALLTAFGLNQHRITGEIARSAIRELSGRRQYRSVALMDAKKALGIFSALSLAVFLLLFHKPIISEINQLRTSPPEAQPMVPEARFSDPEPAVPAPDVPAMPMPAETPAEQVVTAAPEPEPPAEPVQEVQLVDYLRRMDARGSRHTALQQALAMWQIKLDTAPHLESLEDDEAYFRLLSKPSGLFIHRMTSSLELLQKLNVPAILEFYPPGGRNPGYLTLLAVTGDKITLGGASTGTHIQTNAAEIDFYWSGVAYVPWRNYLSIDGTIPKQAYGDSVVALKMLLREIGFKNLEINTDYDSATRDVVEQLQHKYGIPVDGFVGPLTKIILYREKQGFAMPRIAQ